MMMTPEEAILKGQEQFQAIVEFVKRAIQQGGPAHQFEEDLFRQLLGLGLALSEAFVVGQGPGDLGETLEHDGRTLRRLELHPRRYVSVFGELDISRFVYGTRETQKHEVIPLDARLQLPEGDASYLLEKWNQGFCVNVSYAESRATVQEILGIGQSVRGLEQMVESAACHVAEFRHEQPAPPPAEEGTVVVLTADGKGIPMRGPDAPAGAERRNDPDGPKGRKKGGKRMACVGAVYTIAPFVRTAEDVIDEVLRREKQKDRPVPQHKLLRAELSREVEGVPFDAKEEIFTWLGEQVELRDLERRRPTVCVMDGESGLWKRLREGFEGVVGILDLFHVLERLWKAAHCFFPDGSDDAQEFVTDRLRKILQGQVGRVIGGLRQMVTKGHVHGNAKKTLREVIGYLHRHRQLMRYNEYLAAGYPIGSGVAEGGCRHLVKDRMERTGMRWRINGAQAMLELRAVYLNDECEPFYRFRTERERERLYPYQSQINRQWPKAA